MPSARRAAAFPGRDDRAQTGAARFRRPGVTTAVTTRQAPRVRRLTLSDFRSYAALDCRFESTMVALCGENGAGKTNLIEALSLFSPGRGLRRAELGECARRGGAGGFAASIEIETDGAATQLGHGLTASGERLFRVDRTPAASARAFADYVRVLWLTPAMDGLFSGAAGERRRFLDRLALGVDAEHGARANKLERALRNRNRLLEEGVHDRRWLDAAEQEIAAIGVAVAAARRETVSRLSALIATGGDASPFPWASVKIEGELERRLALEPALAVEEWYRGELAASRGRDAAVGRTLIGPQASDLAVRHGPKNEAARACSTGEQKALLMGLTLAHARLVRVMTGRAPLLLLDEVAAHFDVKRREALYQELHALGGQIWMTGADPALFAPLKGRAELVLVTPGRARPG